MGRHLTSIMVISALLVLLWSCDSHSEGVPSTTMEDSSLGIFSETAPKGLEPDVDSFIGVFEGGDASFSELRTDEAEKKEGDLSMKATLAVDGSGYAGWFVSWGNKDQLEDDTHTIDMSDFSGGSMAFWVKSPINLEVGIRSGNVDSGDEESKVLLSGFSTFAPDNTWREICIPLARFEGESPKADLSDIKVLFVVASNRSTGGTAGRLQTFWIDDVRWNKANCP
jgi:hypothetical protein